jgi:2-octaprenylphenol hydroxylase
MTDAEVLIVGGGITGAALALLLAEAGVPVVLVDRATAPPLPPADRPLDVRVSAIHAAAAVLLERFGAWQLIPQRCRAPFGRIEVWDACSAGRIGFDSADIGQPWLGHIVENRALVAALHARLAQLPAARMLAPAGWDDFDVQADAHRPPAGRRRRRRLAAAPARRHRGGRRAVRAMRAGLPRDHRAPAR